MKIVNNCHRKRLKQETVKTEKKSCDTINVNLNFLYIMSHKWFYKKT